jgi:cation diffusion facilitator CzcD-associated flavoprotein CzcO
LVDPKLPNIPGLDRFQGTLFHTARWNHDYDLAGKRIAVIGTGASAVQVVPAIAPQVEALRVFQRSPAWVLPKHDRPIGPRAQRRFRDHPILMRAVRWLTYWMSEAMGPIIILNAPRLSRIGERMSERHLQASVADPALRAKLLPDFQFGCKRMLISDDYWPALERPNVELVTDAIREIGPDGPITADGRTHAVDAIVLATGFALGLATPPFPIHGLGGQTLDDAWSGGATAYKGVTVSGFPNWFIMMGPNTGPGHTSVLVYTESQIAYALQAIQLLLARDLAYVNVRRSVQEGYNARLQRRMKHTVWSSGCTSWYLNPDGSNHALFPGLAFEYCAGVRRFKTSEYELVARALEPVRHDT